MSSIDRQAEHDELRRDLVSGTSDREFMINLDNDVYQVMFIIGDRSSKQKSMDIYAEDVLVVSNLKVSQGSYTAVTIIVNVSDGFLTLKFPKDYWRINGILVTRMV